MLLSILSAIILFKKRLHDLVTIRMTGKSFKPTKRKTKTDRCADKSILSLLSAYQEYPVTFKLMTSQVVQRARPVRTRIYVLGSQMVKIGDDTSGKWLKIVES